MNQVKGFELATGEIKHRLVVAVHGQTGTGKTHWALSATGDIAMLDFNRGTEGVIEHYIDNKKIYKTTYRFRPTDDNTENQTMGNVLWKQSRDDYYAALDGAPPLQDTRSVVVDMACEWYEVARWSMLGKLSKVEPFKYGEVNLQFRTIVEAGLDSEKNVILVHKEKKLYEGKDWYGEYEMAGFNAMGYIPHVVGRTYKEDAEGKGDNGFRFIIEKCRLNTVLEGEVLSGEQCNFANLAWMVFGYEGTVEDWI